MRKTKTMKNEDKPPLFPSSFLIAVAEKGLGFVKSKITVHGPRDIPIWVDQRDDGIAYSADNKPYNLESFFLSPEGRNLMEYVAEKSGANIFFRFFAEREYQSDHGPWTQKPIWFYEFNRCTATHKDRNTACLLAFAQLVGVAIPKEDGDL